MIQTVGDDDSREQHRAWQACADVRAPEVNYLSLFIFIFIFIFVLFIFIY